MNITETTLTASRELDQAQERMQDLRRTAAERLEARNGTAEALESVASSVRSTGRQGAERIDTLSESAAGKLDSTAASCAQSQCGRYAREPWAIDWQTPHRIPSSGRWHRFPGRLGHPAKQASDL